MNQEKSLCPDCGELSLVFTADELGEFYYCENYEKCDCGGDL